jgi:hypothetical protein
MTLCGLVDENVNSFNKIQPEKLFPTKIQTMVASEAV